MDAVSGCAPIREKITFHIISTTEGRRNLLVRWLGDFSVTPFLRNDVVENGYFQN